MPNRGLPTTRGLRSGRWATPGSATHAVLLLGCLLQAACGLMSGATAPAIAFGGGDARLPGAADSIGDAPVVEDRDAEVVGADGGPDADAQDAAPLPEDTSSVSDGAGEDVGTGETETHGSGDADDGTEVEEVDDVDKDSDPDSDPDANVDPDSVLDAIADADLDASADGGLDANLDANADGGLDANLDANADGGLDANLDAGPAWPPTAQALSSCKGKDGQKACSVDGKLRLECMLGAWTPMFHCGFGVCQATQPKSGPPLLSCSVPETAHPQLAAACAQLLPCVAPNLGLQACMRAALAPDLVGMDVQTGALLDPAHAALAGLLPHAACVANASGCAAVAACLGGVACPSGPSQGCQEAMAYHCHGGVALPMGCAKHGAICTVVEGAPRCLLDAPCPAGDVSECNDKVATACLQTPTGLRAVKHDCGASSQNCKAGVAASGNPAAACSGSLACPGAGVPACDGGALALCQGNSLVVTTCPAGEICLFEEDTGLQGPTCAPFSTCPKVVCSQAGSCTFAARCEGTEVFYCELGQPRRYDCKAIGKSCGGGAVPRCN